MSFDRQRENQKYWDEADRRWHLEKQAVELH